MKFIGIPKNYRKPGEGLRTVIGVALLLSLAFVFILGADAMFSNPRIDPDISSTTSAGVPDLSTDPSDPSVPVAIGNTTTGSPSDSSDPSNRSELSVTSSPFETSGTAGTDGTEVPGETTPTPETEPTKTPTVTPAPTTAPVTETAESATYYATAQVNIRSGPGTAYDIVDTLERGDAIQVVASTSNGWKKIGEGRYLTSDFVSKTPPSTPLSGTYYTVGQVNVRSGPGTDYSITRELDKGTAIDVVAITANGWYQTVKNTYVLASLCTKDKPAASPTPTPAPTASPTPTPKPIPAGVAEKAAAVGLSVEDFELMAGIVESERPTGNGNYDGQVWVAQVIWNRVNSSKWPNTVYGVITQTGQFTTWKGGYSTSLAPKDSSREAVVQAYQNPPIPADVLFFNSWPLSDPLPDHYYGSCGGNHFYYTK
jgi:uncharacterized protein YraI